MNSNSKFNEIEPSVDILDTTDFTATQSSIVYDALATKAIDGNKNGDFFAAG